jgi:hypothetical protein
MESVDLKGRGGVDGSVSVGRVLTGRVELSVLVGKGEKLAMPRFIFTMAGYFAECLVNPRIREYHSHSGDTGHALNIEEFATCEPHDVIQRDGHLQVKAEEVDKNAPRRTALFNAAVQETTDFVDRYEIVVRAVAAELRKKKSLTRDDVVGILSIASVQPSGTICVSRVTGWTWVMTTPVISRLGSTQKFVE